MQKMNKNKIKMIVVAESQSIQGRSSRYSTSSQLKNRRKKRGACCPQGHGCWLKNEMDLEHSDWFFSWSWIFRRKKNRFNKLTHFEWFPCTAGVLRCRTVKWKLDATTKLPGYKIRNKVCIPAFLAKSTINNLLRCKSKFECQHEEIEPALTCGSDKKEINV